MLAIETTDLSHTFTAAQRALNRVNLRVPTGAIYGFLGPNGAGKTTTLRLLLGLLRRQQGSIHLFGHPADTRRADLFRRIGSSIESPSLYSHLTAVENLRIWQLAFGCPKPRIERALRLVGLEGTGRKSVAQFSLGMKQRLSIAVALLHEPSLLILDEPTNGLDPHGILEVRDLLVRLNWEEGTTILVSSHLLSEVERLVTDVGIIHRGAMVYQGSMAGMAELQPCEGETLFVTNDDRKALELLRAAGKAVRHEEGKLRMPAVSPAEAGRLNRELISSGIDVHELTTERPGLEQVFLRLVRD